MIRIPNSDIIRHITDHIGLRAKRRPALDENKENVQSNCQHRTHGVDAVFERKQMLQVLADFP